jgi:N-acetylmuramoyl-L-alanine amidase
MKLSQSGAVSDPGKRRMWIGVGVLVAVLAPLAFVVPALGRKPADEGPAQTRRNIFMAALGADNLNSHTVRVLPPLPSPKPLAPAPPIQIIGGIPGAPPIRIVQSTPEVLAMEQKLSSLGYLVGAVDGISDGATKHGLTAFQKVEGLSRTGVADGSTLARLNTASRPTPAFTDPPDHLEVDIPRQVVFVVRGGSVLATLPTATGTNKKFTAQGYTRRAVTPNGRFAVYFKRQGWRTSPLGMLYRPAYFNGGIAFHGAKSVPAYEASHGCVRLPMQFADWFADHASPVGEVVYVYGGPAGDNPQPALETPDSAPAAPDSAAPAPVPPADPLDPLLKGLLNP